LGVLGVNSIKRLKPSKILIGLFLLLFSLVMVLPFIYMILSAFKYNNEIMAIPPTFWPEIPTVDNFALAWNKFTFGIFFRNSLWLSTVKTLIVLYTSALFGYVFNKLTFKGRDALFLVLLATMMIPWPVTLIPMYQLMVWLKWVGNYTSLIVPSLLSSFGIFMMRQFMTSIPNDLIEAARIDGAGEFRAFHQIIIPNITAALSALGIFQFLWAWDDFLWPFLMLSRNTQYTLPVGLALFNGQYANNHGGTLAGATIAVLPMVIVYLLFQRQFIEGIAMTGMKG